MNREQAIRQRERQQKVAALVDASPQGITVRALMAAMGLSRSAARNDLHMLAAAGWVGQLRPGFWCAPWRVPLLQADKPAAAPAARQPQATAATRAKLSTDGSMTHRVVQSWQRPTKTGPASVWDLAGSGA